MGSPRLRRQPFYLTLACRHGVLPAQVGLGGRSPPVIREERIRRASERNT
jgi:hypothetical protein